MSAEAGDALIELVVSGYTQPFNLQAPLKPA